MAGNAMYQSFINYTTDKSIKYIVGKSRILAVDFLKFL